MNTIFNEEMAQLLIPSHMIDGLKRYIENGIEPGSFMQAVLQNNLKQAIYCADSINRTRLEGYVEFLYNYAPAGCCGSEENYNEWILKGGYGA